MDQDNFGHSDRDYSAVYHGNIPYPTGNPGHKTLTGEAASLGAVAGAFIGRQLAIALIGLYGVVRGTTEPLIIGAFGIAVFNLHDAIFITAYNGVKPVTFIGLAFAIVAAVVIWAVLRRREM